MLAASCGGGSSNNGGGSGGGASNTPPTISIPASVTLAENIRDVAVATGADADGDSLTYSVSGGADAGQFIIDNGGQLRFSTAPSFETPRDSNGDNIYEAVVRVSDGTASATASIRVTIENDAEGISVVRRLTGLPEPTDVSWDATGGQLAISHRGGKVTILDDALFTTRQISGFNGPSGQPADLLELHEFVDRNGNAVANAYFVIARDSSGMVELKILATDFDPVDFAGGTVFSRWQFDSDDVDISLASEPGKYNLFIAVGADASEAKATDPLQRFGKLLNLYRNPNPYSCASLCPNKIDIVASGIRAPGSIIYHEGELIFVDWGQSRFEELNRFAGTSADFGWPYFEGDEELKSGAAAGVIMPEIMAPVGTGEGQLSRTRLGPVYAGPNQSLMNKLIMGDAAGRIWTAEMSALTDGSTDNADALELRSLDFTPDAGSIDQVVAITRTSDGRLLIFDKDGEVFEVTLTE